MKLTPNLRTAGGLVLVAAVMVGLTAAAVPLYDWFCRVTGFGGTPQIASGDADTILDRTITVRFDANRETGMPWEFRPEEPSMEVRIGETGLAFYVAHNPTDRPVAGQASYNVAPYIAGGYFNKIACFCFTEQVLEPGETVRMPVSFFVDPEIVEDAEAAEVPAITLSYTFYEIDLPAASETARLGE